MLKYLTKLIKKKRIALKSVAPISNSIAVLHPSTPSPPVQFSPSSSLPLPFILGDMMPSFRSFSPASVDGSPVSGNVMLYPPPMKPSSPLIIQQQQQQQQQQLTHLQPWPFQPQTTIPPSFPLPPNQPNQSIQPIRQQQLTNTQTTLNDVESQISHRVRIQLQAKSQAPIPRMDTMDSKSKTQTKITIQTQSELQSNIQKFDSKEKTNVCAYDGLKKDQTKRGIDPKIIHNDDEQEGSAKRKKMTPSLETSTPPSTFSIIPSILSTSKNDVESNHLSSNTGFVRNVEIAQKTKTGQGVEANKDAKCVKDATHEQTKSNDKSNLSTGSNGSKCVDVRGGCCDVGTETDDLFVEREKASLKDQLDLVLVRVMLYRF